MDRESFDDVDAALSRVRERLEAVRREGGLPPINALRDFAPGQRVHARFELDGPGFIRGPKGGIDVMGDGAIVAYTGSVRKRPLGAAGVDDAFDRLRLALS